MYVVTFNPELVLAIAHSAVVLLIALNPVGLGFK